MDTEALVAHSCNKVRTTTSNCKQRTPTGFDLVQERDIAIATLRVRVGDMGDDVQVLDMLDLLVERGQLVEVGRKHAERVDLGRDVPVCVSLSDVRSSVISSKRTQRWPMPGRIRRMSTSLSPCQHMQ